MNIYKFLSDYEKGQILVIHSQELSKLEIGRQLSRHHGTIAKYLKNLSDPIPKKSPGRKNKLTSRHESRIFRAIGTGNNNYQNKRAIRVEYQSRDY